MKIHNLFRAVVFVVGLTFSFSASAAEIRVTDVITFGASSQGAWPGQLNIWETRPAGNFNNWIKQDGPGGAFLTGPFDHASRPNITLAAGLNTFQIIGTPGADWPRFGINLFFNDQLTPSISAFGPMLTDPNQAHEFVANSDALTPAIDSGFFEHFVPGAGTLSFIVGDQVVTLTDFYWASPTVYNLDLVNQQSVGPDGTTDFVGGITLSVVPVPEPSVLLLGSVAGVFYGGVWRWIRARK